MIKLSDTVKISLGDVLTAIQLIVSLFIIYITANLERRVKRIDRQFNQKVQQLERARDLAKQWHKLYVGTLYEAGFVGNENIGKEYFTEIDTLEVDLKAIVRAIDDTTLSALLLDCLTFVRPTYSSDDPSMNEINLTSIKSGQVTNAKFESFYHRLYVLLEQVTN